MGEPLKITVIVDEDLNRRLRAYIFKSYPDSQYGKLKEVAVDALREFLEKRGF